jgi:hypothetical protein
MPEARRGRGCQQLDGDRIHAVRKHLLERPGLRARKAVLLQRGVLGRRRGGRAEDGLGVLGKVN